MIEKGTFRTVSAYMDDVKVGVGAIYRDHEDAIRGSFILDKSGVLTPDNIFEKIHKFYFSFKENAPGERIGYYVYTEGIIDCYPESEYIHVGSAVFRKALVDVQPEFKYVGMGYE